MLVSEQQSVEQARGIDPSVSEGIRGLLGGLTPFVHPVASQSAEPKPDAATPPPTAKNKRQANPSKPRQEEDFIADCYVPTLMAAAGTDVGIAPAQFKTYRNYILEGAGNPDDPLEQMLVEQATMAHLVSLRMYANAAMAKDAEIAGMHVTAATRVAAEQRRMIMALRTYRGSGGTATTHIEQQNIAERQEITVVKCEKTGDESTAVRDKKLRDTKLGSNAQAVRAIDD